MNFKRPGKKPSKPIKVVYTPPRLPPTKWFRRLDGKTTTVELPHGSFNAGLAPHWKPEHYILCYRPDEHHFRICTLDPGFKIVPGSDFDLGIGNCADPRLIWLGSRLLLVYSSTEDHGRHRECIKAILLVDRDREDGDRFLPAHPFRLSPPGGREKNWMPFVHDGCLMLVASVHPRHLIYACPRGLNPYSPVEYQAVVAASTPWVSPWPFLGDLYRGNTNVVRLDDGNYLGTFHTVEKRGPMHYYDNGAYVFEGVSPFRVLRSARFSYLPAEAAVSRHFRKRGLISVCFPVGMVREGERLLISYGDNDSEVKILDTTVPALLDTMLPVYQ